MNAEQFLTVEEVARKLRRSSRTIRDWINHGCPSPKGRIRLVASKFGRSWEIHPDQLVLFEHRLRPGRRPELDLE
jgi:hypothetical protein